jgi:hypothetical protein
MWRPAGGSLLLSSRKASVGDLVIGHSLWTKSNRAQDASGPGVTTAYMKTDSDAESAGFVAERRRLAG